MYNYARSVDSTVTMDNYFQVASKRLLGTEQSAQFQSGDQHGSSWHWGSKCSADNVCDASATPGDSALAEMPRSYVNGNNAFGDYYNWYAATAGSGTYTMINDDATDSLCPKGWRLAVEDNYAADKSYHNLSNSYGESVSSLVFRSSALSFLFSGYYEPDGMIYHDDGRWWSSSASVSNRDLSEYLRVHDNGIWSDQGTTNKKTRGLTVRCVKR